MKKIGLLCKILAYSVAAFVLAGGVFANTASAKNSWIPNTMGEDIVGYYISADAKSDIKGYEKAGDGKVAYLYDRDEIVAILELSKDKKWGLEYSKRYWILMEDLEQIESDKTFREENGEDIKTDEGSISPEDVDDKDIIFYLCPGSSIQITKSFQGKIEYSQTYVDENGVTWALVLEYYGITDAWIRLEITVGDGNSQEATADGTAGDVEDGDLTATGGTDSVTGVDADADTDSPDKDADKEADSKDRDDDDDDDDVSSAHRGLFVDKELAVKIIVIALGVTGVLIAAVVGVLIYTRRKLKNNRRIS